MNDDIKNICDAKPIPEKQYRWKPQLDITAYELALAIPILSYWLTDTAENIINSVPEGVKRHFEEE